MIYRFRMWLAWQLERLSSWARRSLACRLDEWSSFVNPRKPPPLDGLMAEIVRETLRHRGPQLADEMMRNNALLRRLRDKVA